MTVSLSIVLSLTLILPIFSGERCKPKSVEELTNMNSISYTLHPYPKNKKEIIANLKFYWKEFILGTKYVSLDNSIPSPDIIFKGLYQSNPIYKIAKIVKVKNRIERIAHDYSWLIILMDMEGKVAMRVVMRADGTVSTLAPCLPKDYPKAPSGGPHKKLLKAQKLISQDDVIKILFQTLNRPMNHKEIKKMERVAYISYVGSTDLPAWEIQMKDGSLYYYSEHYETLYTIEKRIPWKKGKKGYRPSLRNLVTSPDYLPDTISDELIYLKRIPGKKK